MGPVNVDRTDAAADTSADTGCAPSGVSALAVEADTSAPGAVLAAPAAPAVDADGDGHTAASQGGDDCNDTNAEVHPGAAERPYDGIDQDCSGDDLDDLDGDGWRGTRADGGDDCNDGDPTVHPGVTEVCNVHDDDCDGLVDEGCATPRALADPGGIWWACAVVPPRSPSESEHGRVPVGGAWCWLVLILVAWRLRSR